MGGLYDRPFFLPQPRSIVYVDGFNLYYGAVRGTAYKWLDLARFFRLLRPNEDLRRVRYFTALVDGPRRANQEMYLRALSTTPLVEVILGKFKPKRIKCQMPGCTHQGGRFFVTYEEKRTDVNIAVRMLDDAYQDHCDRLILVSGDSDLVPAVATVRERFPQKKVTVYVPAKNPTRGAAVELRTAANVDRALPLNLLEKAQFSAVLADTGGGSEIRKPAAW